MALITGVLSHEADAWWPHAAPLLAKVDYDTGWTLDDLLEAVKARKKQLWVCATSAGIVAAAITEITQYPQHRGFHVFYLGGDGMAEWLPNLLNVFDAYAKANGCKYVSCTGRRGWVRELKRFGWGEEATVVRKEIV